MDKVKAVIRKIVKYRFWLLCGLVVLVSVGSWHMAAGRLHDESKKNDGDIDGKYKAAQTLKSKKDCPNDFSNVEMDKLNAETLHHVIQAWERQYDRQLDLLKWDDELREDFIAAVRPLKPIELKIDPPPTPLTQELKVDFRQRYANYVGRLLPKLAVRIGAQWAGRRSDMGGGGYDAGGMGMPGMGPGMGPGTRAKTAAMKPPLVLWNSADQGRLLQVHFDWSQQPDAAPTTLQVLYAQEDLWVLQALMEVISKTNGNIDSRHEATVKTIESILIGRAAPPRVGRVQRLMQGQGGAGGPSEGMMPYGDPGAMGSPMGPMGPAGPAGPEAGGSMSAGPGPQGSMSAGPSAGPTGPGMMPSVGGSLASNDPGEWRYVDTNYKPVEIKQLREALKANPPDPKNAFLVVAKRMQVRIRLIVDQRKLHRLMAECGNSPLPIEIRQVRINRQAGAASGGMEGGMSPGYGGGDVGGMPPGYGGGEIGGMPMGSGTAAPEAGPGPGYGAPEGGMFGGFMGTGDLKSRAIVSSTNPAYDVPIEVYGVIYIYNPVAKEKLGVQPAVSPPAPAVPAA